MPRRERRDWPGAVHHVMNRGIARRPVFLWLGFWWKNPGTQTSPDLASRITTSPSRDLLEVMLKPDCAPEDRSSIVRPASANVGILNLVPCEDSLGFVNPDTQILHSSE